MAAETLTKQIEQAIQTNTYKKPTLAEAQELLTVLIDKAKSGTLNQKEEKEQILLIKYLNLAKNPSLRAKKETSTLKKETSAAEEVKEREDMLSTHTKNLEKVAQKLGDALKDGKLQANSFTWGELDFIKDGKSMDDAVLAYITPGSLLHNDKALQSKLTGTFEKINFAIIAYKNTVNVKGKVEGEHSHYGREHVKGFLSEMNRLSCLMLGNELKESDGVTEVDKWSEELKSATPAELLVMYTAAPEEDIKRTLVVSAFMQNYIEAGEYELVKAEDGTYHVSTKAGVEVKKDNIEVQKINSTLEGIGAEYVGAYRAHKTLETVGFSEDEKLNPRNIVNKIFEKYNVLYKDGSAKFQDLKDPERKDALTKTLTVQINTSKNLQEKTDLQYALDLAGDEKNRNFDAKLINEFHSINKDFKIGDKSYNLGEEFANGNGIGRIISEILTSNGGYTGLFVLATAVYMMFTGKMGKLMLATGGIIALTAGEEVLSESGLGKEIIDMVKGMSPEIGGMMEKVIGLNPLSRPKYEPKFMQSEHESGYKILYNENLQKLEDGKIEGVVSEEDFAQIYGQLLENDSFRGLSIEELGKKINAGMSLSDPSFLGTNTISEYTDIALINNDDEDAITKTRHISEKQVLIVIKSLLKKQDNTGDVKGADLFVIGGASKDVGMDMGIEGAGSINRELDEAYATMSSDNPAKVRVGNILGLGDNWSFANAKWTLGKVAEATTDSFHGGSFTDIFDKIGDKASKKALLSAMLAELGKLSLPTGTHKEELDVIIKLLEKLRTREAFNGELGEFTKKATDKSEGGFYGSERIAKRLANGTLAGISALARTTFAKSSFALDEFNKVSISDVDTAISDGNALLAEQKSLAFGGVTSLLITKIDKTTQEISGVFNTSTGNFDFGSTIQNVANIHILSKGNKGAELDLNTRELEAINSSVAPTYIPLQTKETTQIVDGLSKLYKYKAVRLELEGKKTESEAATLGWLNVNPRGVLEQLKAMEGSMEALSSISADTGVLGDYFSVLRQNFDNIAELNMIKNSGINGEVSGSVDGLLQKYTTFQQGFLSYLQGRQEDINDVLVQDLGELSLTEYKEKYDTYKKLKDEFMGESISSDIKAWCQQMVGANSKIEKDNVENMVNLIKSLGGTSGLTWIGDLDFEGLLERGQTYFDNGLATIVTRSLEKINKPYTLHNNPGFINGIKEVREATSGIDNIAVGQKVEHTINTYIESMITALLKPGATANEIAIISDDFQAIKSQIGGGDWPFIDSDGENKFEDTYSTLLRDKKVEALNNSTSTNSDVAKIYEDSGLSVYLREHGAISTFTMDALSSNPLSMNIQLLNNMIGAPALILSAGEKEFLKDIVVQIKSERDKKIDGFIGRYFIKK